MEALEEKPGILSPLNFVNEHEPRAFPQLQFDLFHKRLVGGKVATVVIKVETEKEGPFPGSIQITLDELHDGGFACLARPDQEGDLLPFQASPDIVQNGSFNGIRKHGFILTRLNRMSRNKLPVRSGRCERGTMQGDPQVE